MYKLMVIFHQSGDTAELEQQWSDRFVVQAERMPGLCRISVSRVCDRLVEQTRIHLIHEFFFENEHALHRALGSPEGKAAGEALMSFAARDVTLLTLEHWEEARGQSAPGPGTGSSASEDLEHDG